MLNSKKILILLPIIVLMVLIACSHVKDSKARLSRYGTLTINAIPWGEVYIDGKKADQRGSKTPFINYPIPPGEHIIEVKREGYDTYRRYIRVIRGEHYIYSAILPILPILFSKDKFDFHLIYGIEDLKKMEKVAIVVGPRKLEEKLQRDIKKYVEGFAYSGLLYNMCVNHLYRDIVKYIKAFGEFDTILLYSYQEAKTWDEIANEMKKNIDNLIEYSGSVSISYFDRHMKTEQEMDELRKTMQPYERRKIAKYRGSCVF